MDPREIVLYGVGFVAVFLFVFQMVAVRFTIVRVERKLNLVLERLGIDPMQPPSLPERVKEIARDPGRKIEAIRALREETGLSLAEAKAAIEAYIATLDHNNR